MSENNLEIKQVMFWQGKRIDDLTKDELIEVVGFLAIENKMLRENALQSAKMWGEIVRGCPAMSETIPAEYRALADEVVDRGFNEGLIDAIALALLSAEKRGAERAERFLALRERQNKTSDKFWIRAAKEALAGDVRALRLRIEMFEAEPVDVVLSDASAIRKGAS